jgi:hypothetical protein
LPGVVILDRPCEPDQAFVIGHRRHIVRDDRRYRVIGMKDWHQITSGIETGEGELGSGIRRFVDRFVTRISLARRRA